jgi:hypothetical protein
MFMAQRARAGFLTILIVNKGVNKGIAIGNSQYLLLTKATDKADP